MSHDIDLVLPFTRNKSNRRQSSEASPSEAHHEVNPSSQAIQTYPMIRVMSAQRDSTVEDDDFERDLSSEKSTKALDIPDDESLRKQSEALKEARKKQRKAVARIQKNKVNFLSVTGAA